jgi:hypothetical protein
MPLMVRIDSHTTRKELLGRLVSEAKHPGPLYIEIESLPSFLNTKVSFTIFQYQINNYPRRIIWTTKDQTTIDFLREVGAECQIISKATTDPTVTNDLEKQLEIILATQSPSKPAQLSENRAVNLSSTQSASSSKTLISGEPAFSIGLDNPDQNPAIDPNTEVQADWQRTTVRTKPKNQKFLTSFPSEVPDFKENYKRSQSKVKFSFPTFPTDQPDYQSYSSINSDDFFKESVYRPSSLLQSEVTHSTNLDTEAKSDPSVSQNLDSWLSRIEATKAALTNLKEKAPTSDRFATFKNNHDSTPKRLPKSFYLVAGSLALSLVFIGFLIFFPTTAYTLQVRDVSLQAGTTVDLTTRDFNKKMVKLSTESSIPASGQKEVSTERATGRVSLINPGNKDVQITNGAFRLVNEDKAYQALTNSTLSQTIVIPAKNNLNGPAIEISIQSRVAGAEYNLPEGTTFKIYNLLGASVCNSCYAVAITPIKNTELSGKKIVTEADYSILKSTSDGLLAEKRLQEIKNLQDDQIITNTNWYRNQDTSFQFSKQIGEVADNVSLKQDVSTDIYYITRGKLEELLKTKNRDIAKITDLAIVESSGQFDSQDSKHTLKIFYTYTKEESIDKGKVVQMLQEKEFEQAKSDLQKDFPAIKDIEKRELGMKLPGIPNRVDVSIVKKDDK